MDLSKAFDTLDHHVLLRKLKYYGVTDGALNWFESYLTNRKQFTIIEDKKSTLLNIITGVPQGSILGPLLFIIYINDLDNSLNKFKSIKYADDTTLWASLSSFGSNTEINNELNKKLSPTTPIRNALRDTAHSQTVIFLQPSPLQKPLHPILPL